MKRCMIAMCFPALAVSAALAQEKKTVPLPSKPAHDGSSLEVTIKGIQGKLNGIDPLNYVAYVHDNVTGQDSTSGVIKKEVTEVVADPYLIDNNLPPTMTVRTAALLELHAMRKSAVGLCIQLPTKYRTHLPECADIFKHEIRLTALAKDRK